MNSYPSLGHEEAVAAGERVRSECARRGWTAVVAVADAHGEIVLLLRMDGAPSASTQIATNKAWTAARLRRPTSVFAKRLIKRNLRFEVFGDPRFVNEPGGLPVYRNGCWLGAVAVSGTSRVDTLALQTDADDEALALAGVALICDDYPPSIWNEFEGQSPDEGVAD